MMSESRVEPGITRQLVDRLLAKIEARMCDGRTLDRVVELNDILAKLGEGKVAAHVV